MGAWLLGATNATEPLRIAPSHVHAVRWPCLGTARGTLMTSTSEALPADGGAARVLALDWTRGIVVVLMTVDHASKGFYRDRIEVDAPYLYHPGMLIPAVPFFLRWITYACAPTFLFLAGTSLMLTLAKRARSGASPWTLDRYLLTRGAILIALDTVWMSLAFERAPGDTWVQILATIGFCMILMIPLRRLPTSWLLAVLPFFAVAIEQLQSLVDEGSTLRAVIFEGGTFPDRSIFDGSKSLLFSYPFAPWWCFFALGWCFGGLLSKWRTQPDGSRTLLRVTGGGAVGALLLFVLVRGLNGYGNAGQLRDREGVIQWLNVSATPPALAHMGLTMGIMALILFAGFYGERQGWLSGPASRWLIVFGQSALFFYLLHIHLLVFSARLLGVESKCGLAVTLVAFAATLVILHPLCARYHAYRLAHPGGWTRFF